MTAVIALVTFLAQNSQDAPEEGVGIGLILLGVLVAVGIAIGIWLAFTRSAKRDGGKAPEDRPHEPGHVGH